MNAGHASRIRAYGGSYSSNHQSRCKENKRFQRQDPRDAGRRVRPQLMGLIIVLEDSNGWHLSEWKPPLDRTIRTVHPAKTTKQTAPCPGHDCPGAEAVIHMPRCILRSFSGSHRAFQLRSRIGRHGGHLIGLRAVVLRYEEHASRKETDFDL